MTKERAKEFLVGRLIDGSGFPIRKDTLKDGYYSINNICQIMEDYLSENQIERPEQQCRFYTPGMDTSMNCINCGKSKLTHNK